MSLPQPLKIGMIGLDTSHCQTFARLLHDESDPNHIPGARIVAGCPAATPDWDKSAGRVDRFTTMLREEYGAAIFDRPEAVAEASDLVMITAVDGRRHRALFEQIAPQGRPTFIDKPFATSVADAEAMLTLAGKHDLPLMSSSALRYADTFQTAMRDDRLGPIRGIDVFGPMALEGALPGLLWYGCHGIEMIVAAMGPGCRDIQVVGNENGEMHSLTWDDGRLASYRGIRDGASQFGATIHRKEGFQQIDILASDRPFYVGLLEAVLASLPEGRSDVPSDQMREVVRIMELGNQVRSTSL